MLNPPSSIKTGNR